MGIKRGEPRPAARSVSTEDQERADGRRRVERARTTEGEQQFLDQLGTVSNAIRALQKNFRDLQERTATMTMIAKNLQSAREQLGFWEELEAGSRVGVLDERLQLFRGKYMAQLHSLEETLIQVDELLITREEGDADHHSYRPRKQMYDELVVANGRLEDQLPDWLLRHISSFASGRGTAAYIYGGSSRLPDGVREADLDEQYEDAVVSSGAVKRAHLFHVLDYMLIRAVKSYSLDRRDPQGDTHRGLNTLAHLREEWSTRFPPIVEKYDQMMSGYSQMMELLDIYFNDDDEDV